MVESAQPSLLAGIAGWLDRERSVRAVVLFGSRARSSGAPATSDQWSDFDLQVVCSDPARIVAAHWAKVTSSEICMQVLRPASSGMRKLTLLVSEGEIDLVIVPVWQLRTARLALTLGLHRRIPRVAAALNNISTIMGGGYRLLKGEREWGPFYARVVAELPGFRLSNCDVAVMADGFVCDFHWVLQKLQRGELVAAQRILHRSLVETNIALRHEARIRAGAPTFQQARRVEKLLEPDELRTVQINARLDRVELARAAWTAFESLAALMRELEPAWRLPPSMIALLAGLKPDQRTHVQT